MTDFDDQLAFGGKTLDFDGAVDSEAFATVGKRSTSPLPATFWSTSSAQHSAKMLG